MGSSGPKSPSIPATDIRVLDSVKRAYFREEHADFAVFDLGTADSQGALSHLRCYDFPNDSFATRQGASLLLRHG